MSEDLIYKIEELIKSERGDVGRLQDILTAIKNGDPVSFDDHHYIETLTQSQSPPKSENSDNLVTDVKPENALDSDIPESTSEIPNIEGSEKITKVIPTKKYAIVGIIVAIALVAYIGLDVYAVNNLQFRPHQGGQQIIISDTELAIKSDVCNPAYFPATFTKYEITAFYNSAEIEKATINGTSLSPKSAAILDGIFAINKEAMTKIGKENTTFDATKAVITTSVVAPIFGFIPYTVDVKYPAQDFQNRIKNPPPGTFDCI